MKKPEFQEEKLSQVMKLLEEAASLMGEKGCTGDPAAKRELNELQDRLRKLTGNKKLNIRQYQEYWACVSLETAAKMAMLAPPEKCGLDDAALRQIISDIALVKVGEAEMSYFLRVLEIETGLDNVSDYIFYPDLLGMARTASVEEIAERILADRKESNF